MKLHFIVGMSRAGTTWLAKTLNEHSQVVVIGETSFFGRAWEDPGPSGIYSTDQVRAIAGRYTGRRGRVQVFFGGLGLLAGGPGSYRRIDETNCEAVLARVLNDAHGPSTPRILFEQIAQGVADAEDKSVVVEKTPHHLNWVDRIAENFPESKFVVLVRDAYGFMRSYKHYVQTATALDGAGNNLNYHPAACAMIWRGYVRSAFDVLARYPDRTLRLDFDAMTRRPEESMERVQSFLGVARETIAGRVPRDNSSFKGRSAGELDPDDVFWMNLLAAAELRRMDIQPRPTAVGPKAIARSVGALGPWGYRAFRTLSARTQGSVVAYVRRWVNRPTA